MVKTKLILKTILFVPIAAIIFALVYAVVGFFVSSGGPRILVGIVAAILAYWFFVIESFRVLSRRDLNSLPVGFDGRPAQLGYPAAKIRPPKPAIYAPITWWETYDLPTSRLAQPSLPALSGLVLHLDNAVQLRRRLLEKKRWARNDHLLLVQGNVSKVMTTTTTKNQFGNLVDYDVSTRYKFRAFLLDDQGRHLWKREQEFSLSPNSWVQSVGFVEPDDQPQRAPSVRNHRSPNRLKHLLSLGS